VKKNHVDVNLWPLHVNPCGCKSMAPLCQSPSRCESMGPCGWPIELTRRSK